MLIKQKLWINTAILVVSMLFMLGLITYSVSSLENDIQINKQIAEVDVLVLQLRRNEKDFLARKQLKYVDKYQQNFTKLRVTIDELDESFRAINQEHVEFEQLRSTLIKYKQHFESIVKVQQDIGLHPKDGLYGQLRAAVHQVERFIADNNFQLLSDMLQLRRNEKDFMLRLDEKYLLKWQDNANLFINHVNASGYEAVIKQQINDSLASYQLAFSNLVKAQKKIRPYFK
jgi:methyl-accepting chemotaxis protein